MTHEPAITLAQLAAKAAKKFTDIQANSGLIREEFLVLANDANNESILADDLPNSTALLNEWLGRNLDRFAKRGQTGIKKSLSHPQGHLDLGEDYDLVVLVCGAKALSATAGRMTTLGAFSADDLVLMDLESDLNLKNAGRAHRQFHDGAMRQVPILRQFRDYRTYRQSQGKASA